MSLLLIVCVPCDPFQSSESPDVAIVSALNARFRAGTVSDDPAAAGVVLHGLNPQLGKGPTPWLSSERAARVSCVIANARLPFIFYGWRRNPNLRSPGFVLRPSVVKRALLCAYGHDFGTDNMNCPAGDWRASPNKCTPGCPSQTNPGRDGSVVGLNLSQAMFVHEERVARLAASMPSDERASPAASLERARLAMQQQYDQYNELVLAADTCNSLLPSTIEAVYMLPHTTITDAVLAAAKRAREIHNETVWPPPYPEEDDERRARLVHAQLLHRFNLTAQQLPLLELNISDRAAPFRLAPRLTGTEYQTLKSSLPPPPRSAAPTRAVGPVVLAPFVAPQPQWSSDDVLRFVHIGKCGGTTIDHWLRSVKDKFIGTATSGYESYHMNQLYMESPYAGHSNFVVWVRDPIDRFQSAYDWQLSVINAPIPDPLPEGWSCKLGPGCPAPEHSRYKAETGHAYPYGEGPAYEEMMLHFDSANHLAESIYASDDDGNIARRLMRASKEHLAKGIGWYLENGAFVRQHHRRMFVGSVENMDADRRRLSQLLGDGILERNGDLHIRTSHHDAKISAKGARNLRQWYNNTDYAALRELVRLGLLDPNLYDLS